MTASHRRWVADLALGIRLAVGGGRTSWVRLSLTALGVGLGVMVLLAATSVPNMLEVRGERGDARAVSHLYDGVNDAIPGVDPVFVVQRSEEFLGRGVQGYLIEPTGPAAPRAPGVRRLPGPGESVLSPALSALLNSPEGALLRPRFTQRVIGTIAEDGLTGPNDLFFYVGENLRAQPAAAEVYRFGSSESGRPLGSLEWLLVILGSASFLIPVVVFVATSTRLAASARDRRLAALRLIGADGKRVRRIAAGEAFVGALAGLVLGGVLFLVARSLVPYLSLSALRGGIFTEDIRPRWTLGVLIAVMVPLLAVGVAVLSLRRTIIEPLGVVRRAKQSRRKLWWRLLPIVVGAGLLETQGGRFASGTGAAGQTPVLAGVVLLLMAVPLVLPWVVERVVLRLRGGSPAWQIAVRRLQLDSGTAARVVGGVAVVLTGAIALQSLFIPAQSRAEQVKAGTVEIRASLSAGSLAESARFVTEVRGLPGFGEEPVSVSTSLQDTQHRYVSMTVGSCAEFRVLAELPSCADGDVFYAKSRMPVQGEPTDQVFTPAAGQAVSFSTVRRGVDSPQWTIPAGLSAVGFRPGRESPAMVLATPGALASTRGVTLFGDATLRTPNTDPLFVEQVRNTLAPLGWKVSVYSLGTGVDETYLLVKRILDIGSVITLLLAAASLMVVALEQMRERRRTLAALMATGVPRGLLARSLLWQMAIPIVLAVAIAVAAGLGLAALLLTAAAGKPVVFDWSTVAVYSGTGMAAVLLVTGLTLPALWRAAGAEGLRGE
ncbi:FtsX-like permease family protein [Amycolatopsis sp. H20-H5]|uniref:FtsX-like permease family protein n=1 Tax=Amycolatopsis sp. H20-H5 TaxID=3046309 RepID=UPI002DB72CFB|nr:FtsX-like permease family protein [Amycolatopsis sp. H20-H5]MEC3973861.1 FtsX-like permease family protein [Amycolatopsis sp. H20-H5]